MEEDKYYYKDGTVSSELDPDKTLHREDGPACIEIGFGEAWFFNGVRHREDGPAVINSDGSEQWWKHGKRIDRE